MGKEMKKRGKPVEGTKESGTVKVAPTQMVSISKLFSMADRWDMLLMCFGTVGAIARGISAPISFILFGRIFESYGTSTTSTSTQNAEVAEALLTIGYVYLGVSAMAFIGAGSETFCWMYSGERQAMKLRRRYIEAVLRQEVGYFDTESNSAEILANITQSILEIMDGTGEKVGHGIGFATLTIASLIVAAYLCWPIALLTLVVVPSVSAAGGFYQKTLGTALSRNKAAYSKANSIVEETLSQVRTVYSYVGETRAAESFSQALKNCVKLGSQAGLAKGLGVGVLNGTMNLSYGLLFYVGGILFVRGQSPPGHIIISILCVYYGGLSFGFVVPDIEAFMNARRSAYPLYAMLERVPTVKDSLSVRDISLTDVQGAFELRNVNFSYPSRPEAIIFADFSVNIHAGKSLAFVGQSGSGKSTVISLLARFYDPLKGKVLLDGVDIKEMKLESLRRCIGLVGQEPALFATSILENIGLGHPGATLDECIGAAKAANAHSFITLLPDGYNTHVGDRGSQLSGGQKQRIAIARAVLKNPVILLLDEATSALDAESERVVQAALDSLMLGRTSVVVAHRLSTICNVDSIAVLEGGKIVEQGSHADLTAMGKVGKFFQLAELQAINKKVAREQVNSVSSSPQRSSFSSRSPPQLSICGSSPVEESLQRLGTYQPSPTPEFSRTSLEISESQVIDFGSQETDVMLHKLAALKQIAHFTRPEWKRVVIGCLGAIASAAVKPVLNYFFVKAALVLFEGGHVLKEIEKYSAIFAFLAFYSVISAAIEHSQLMRAGETITRNVRARVFTAILRNEMGWFDKEQNTSATLTGKLSADSACVNTAVASLLSATVNNVASVIFAIALSLTLDWRMTLVCIALMPLYLVGALTKYKRAMGYVEELKVSYEKASTYAVEAVTNIRTVASFTMEKGILEQFTKLLEGPWKDTERRCLVASLLCAAGFCITGLAYAITMFYLHIALQHDQVAFGNAFGVFQITSNTSLALSELLAIIPAFAQVKIGITSVVTIITRKTQIDSDDVKGKKLDKIKGFIEFQGVNFRYPSRPEVVVLDNLNVKITSSKTVALVGESGSGKSSIISLLERFYDPTSGRILIDGVDIRKINLKWLRQRIGLVQQEPMLFNTTIKQNISYGEEEATEAEIIEAAKAANAHNFISGLPDGYDSGVGDRGSQLSGGQKQRIAIARAILKNPRILLLDEATSALDTESERIVQQTLDKLLAEGSRTTLVVAHRLSTIRHADIILVMSNGRIVEQGNHETLVSTAGLYARLVASAGRREQQ